MVKAQIVADSLSPQGDRLTSILCTFPRMILAEVNTHRMLSKNTSSSRAIPFNKMVEAVKENPFIPMAWQKHHPGMQGSEYFSSGGGDNVHKLTEGWLRSRDAAIQIAEGLHNSGVTKQLCNRLLEPFMWTTMLITGSKEGWDNFFLLRLPEYHLEGVPTVNKDLNLSSKAITLIGKSKKELLKAINQIDSDSYTGFKTIVNSFTDLDWLQINKGQAEIHIMALAEAIYDAMNESIPLNLNPGEYHIPFKSKIFLDLKEGLTYEEMVKISTAMAARTFYTVVGDEKEIDYQKMIELHDKLVNQNPFHASPFEHCARAMSDEEYNSFIKGYIQTKKVNSFGELRTIPISNNNPILGWHRNFKGFIQYRHILEV